MVVVSPEAIGAAIAAIVVAIEELKIGMGRRAIAKRRRKTEVAEDAHAAIPEVVDGIDRIEDKVDNVDEKVDDLHHTVAYFHRDQLVDDPLARDRLDVEADDDLLRGGD